VLKRGNDKTESQKATHTTASLRMMITVTVDSRESALYASILAQQATGQHHHRIDVTCQPLELGDVKITLSHQDTVHRELVFERKTLPDMVSSIHDGRYREQKARMLANIAPQNISYIVEGDSICDSLRRDAKNVSSAYFNMVFRDDVHLFTTQNVHETGLLLLSLCGKMMDKPANYTASSRGGAAIDTDSYTNCLKLKSKKNSNITPGNCFVMQLAQVPSISNVIAKKIATVFPNIASLVSAMRDCKSANDKQKLLSSIDKVGKAKAAKILEFMQL